MNTPFDYTTLTSIERTLKEVFGLKSDTKIRAYEELSPHRPKENNKYLFQAKVLQFLLFWWMRNDHKPLWVWGHTGTGKTSILEQFFSRLNIPVFRQEMKESSRFDDWVGHTSVNEEGQFYFKYGSLALAMKYGGIFMMEEADKLPNGEASALHGVLDGKPLIISENGGEPIYPHENFRIVVTANTNGTGDPTGLYPESKIQDVAYMARFLAHEVGYMSPDLEKKVLKLAVDNKIGDKTLDKMLRFAGEVREVFTSTKVEVKNKVRITMEVRSLIDWALMTDQCSAVCKQGIAPIEYALEGVLLSKASAGDRDKLETAYQRIFGKNFGEQVSSDKEED